ncbi:hypothetical protein HYH03_002325 [Edaphochlamys debaryana]|uniref:Uncharacterized protein n=1 Tax=Edaphochlamys debaryana TaxID=47281 RepID=A0A835YK47_9CHLO|nr:hypothetical protein HYH03_002325 [Edaphochlamys debaryana]|eukprot:KAG2500045.1 hypothetical protein HYH03_002325 [Edaphochlamys debaryana]
MESRVAQMVLSRKDSLGRAASLFAMSLANPARRMTMGGAPPALEVPTSSASSMTAAAPTTPTATTPTPIPSAASVSAEPHPAFMDAFCAVQITPRGSVSGLCPAKADSSAAALLSPKPSLPRDMPLLTPASSIKALRDSMLLSPAASLGAAGSLLQPASSLTAAASAAMGKACAEALLSPASSKICAEALLSPAASINRGSSEVLPSAFKSLAVSGMVAAALS